MRYLSILLIFWSACAPTGVEDTPFDEPMCEVVRRADGSGVVTDRFVFSELGLVSHAWQLGPRTRGLRVNTYENGRLVSAKVDEWTGAHEISEYGAWQMRLVEADADLYTHYDLTFAYTKNGELAQREVVGATSAQDTIEPLRLRYVLSYNEQGQKIREAQFSGDAEEPWLVYTYTYRSDGRLDTMHVVQNGRPRDVKFVYDERGNLIRRVHGENQGLLYDFDENGRLIGWNGQIKYKRAPDGLILESSVGKTGRYTYMDGRLTEAHFDDGSGYKQRYSAGCPSGFTHPLVTPTSAFQEYYEGPPLRYKWVTF
ncbi:MAG: hypothetical protein R3E66_18815 [bacterium]